MHRSAHHDIVWTEEGLPRRGVLSRGCSVALAGWLALAPACLNPDISDEAPRSVEVASLDGGDTDTTDESAEDESAEDESAEDESAESDESAEDDEPAEDEPPEQENRARPARDATRR